MIAACSGGAGDLVYSIPILRKLKVDTVYVKENFYFQPHGNLHQTMKRLMESQGFKCLPTSGAFPWGTFEPGLKYDYNIDDFRNQRRRNSAHIIVSIMKQFRVALGNWKKPWLNIPGERLITEPYTLIHLTPRWRERSKVDWKKVLHGMEGKVYFVGFQYEWVEFCSRYGNVEWLPTEDILEMAVLIRDADRVYCNQSVSLALCQGMGKQYWYERKPGKKNTSMFLPNEHIL